MAPKSEACAECTQNCLLMHKRERNPSPIATTFFKVMFGEDPSKLMILPPRFAHIVQKKVGKATWLEDSNGEKWKVKITKIDEKLAFEEGWNEFWVKHGLKEGDFLVFHYIMESHFVVLMYGESGCPEIRHFGFSSHQMKDSRKEDRLTIVDQTPSNVNTNGHHQEIKDKNQEIEDTVEIQEKETRIKKNKTDEETSQRSKPLVNPNPETSQRSKHLVNSNPETSQRSKPLVNSNPETSQRSKPLVNPNPETSQRSKPLVNTNPDNTICETPINVNQNNIVHVENIEDEELRGEKSLHDLLVSPEKSSGGRKNDVATGGGGDGAKVEENSNTIKKRLRSTWLPTSSRKIDKKEPVLTSQTDVSGSILHNAGGASTEILHKEELTPTKILKKEVISTNKHDTSSGSKFHNVGAPSLPPAPAFLSPKVKPIEMHESDRMEKKKDAILQKVKPEPVDYDDTLSPGASNPLFSAVMTSYKYLVLPKWVKMKSKVILLRNKGDLWPVLYQEKVRTKALTQSWGVFAKERGIEPGDTCEFVLESEASRSSCSVFKVHVTRK